MVSSKGWNLDWEWGGGGKQKRKDEIESDRAEEADKEGGAEIKLNATDRGMRKSGMTRGDDREDGIPTKTVGHNGCRDLNCVDQSNAATNRASQVHFLHAKKPLKQRPSAVISELSSLSVCLQIHM